MPRRAFAEILDAVLDLAWPKRCAACSAPAEAGPFCEICAMALEPVPRGCPSCAAPGLPTRCGVCLADPPSFDRVLAGGLFGGPLADAVHQLKYRDRPAIAGALGRWLAACAEEVGEVVVASVPLGRRRRIERGYDQAALLARSVAGTLGRPCASLLLQRVRETPPQVGLSREARRQNVRGAFAASFAARGADVLLIDDVVTTGATVDACAEAVKKAGARTVTVLALARAE